MDGLNKIVLCGPESSGKSTLGKQLATHFNAVYIEEYARIYLEKHGAAYNYDLLREIAGLHLKHQQIYLSENSDLFFLDTDFINYHIWSKVVFGKVSPFITENMEREKDHKYLLLYPDLHWQKDPLRENPHKREELFLMHLQLIEQLKRPFEVIKGYGNQRFENAAKAVIKLLGENKNLI